MKFILACHQCNTVHLFRSCGLHSRGGACPASAGWSSAGALLSGWCSVSDTHRQQADEEVRWHPTGVVFLYVEVNDAFLSVFSWEKHQIQFIIPFKKNVFSFVTPLAKHELLSCGLITFWSFLFKTSAKHYSYLIIFTLCQWCSAICYLICCYMSHCMD